MASSYNIFSTVLTLGMYLFILRLWMQFIRANFYNPMTQFVVKFTQPVLAPLKRYLPMVKNVDTANALIVYLLGLIKVMMAFSLVLNAPVFLPQYLFMALVAGLHAAGHLIFWLLVLRAILSWVSRGQSPVEHLLYQLTEPFVAPIRKFVPPVGQIDLSFMIFVLVLMVLNWLASNLFGLVWILM